MSFKKMGIGAGLTSAVAAPINNAALVGYLGSLDQQANDLSGLSSDGGVPADGGYVDTSAADAQALADEQAAATGRVNAQYDQGSAAIDAAAKQLSDRAAALNKQVGDTNAQYAAHAASDAASVQGAYTNATSGIKDNPYVTNPQPTLAANGANASTFMSALNTVSNREMADRASNSDLVTAGAKSALALAKFQALQDIAGMATSGGSGGGGGSYGGSSRYGSGSGTSSDAPLGTTDSNALAKLASASTDTGGYRANILADLNPKVRAIVLKQAAGMTAKNPLMVNAGPIKNAILNSKYAKAHPNRAKAQAKVFANAAATQRKAKQAAQKKKAAAKASWNAYGTARHLTG